ncbi:hypothetical protein [Nitrospirillum sp. BR 11828]|uniref:hypothetical protein n=1 Tax=Nitrospirillum sp. BR 11828 TaxID=3104325 RepID=UPI002ACB01ED|nr:hypothetical protein [Nitrospirillum sp. BR 11828]MDZ5649288.1 hypothetical protein [Nitrospirillum sp. BR 11828]
MTITIAVLAAPASSSSSGPDGSGPSGSSLGGADGELMGHLLIAYAMGCAARREGHSLLSNPFEATDPLGSLGDVADADAWREGWLSGG